MVRPEFKRFMALVGVWAGGIVGLTVLALLLREFWKWVGS